MKEKEKNKTTRLSLGFSPCPNDCFIFDAMIHGKIDTEGLEFEVFMEDVETLNNKAFHSLLDITKLSFHAFLYLTDNYILLNSGSALGFNCGPLLISKKEIKDYSKINDLKIAIPGKNTTANLLLSIAFPGARNKHEMVFSEIEKAVLNEEADAGLIIHENRFTYEQKGLKKIIDLGEFWDSMIQAPIPLGGIVVRKNLGLAIQQKIDRVIRRSVEFAFSNPESCMDFVKAHAQEMQEEVMRKHIALYVNKYSVDLSEEGKNAVKLLFEKAKDIGIINKVPSDIFIS